MTFSKDVPQGESNPRRRVRRPLPTYPDSPILIPSERKEAAKESLGKVHELWQQGRHYNALTEWFGLPLEKREDVIASVLLQEAEPAGRSLKDIQYDTEGKPENLIFQHYALLTMDAVRKIIGPDENDPITDDDTNDIISDRGQEISDAFEARKMSLGLGSDPYYHDMYDFTLPKEDITRNFSLEEAREFLSKLIPHISGDVKRRLLGSFGVVSVIKWADLLTDPRLADALEKPLLREQYWDIYIGNYFAQESFPSAEFFEEAFRRLKPEDSDPNATFQISVEGIRNTEVPASAFYFMMLRRIPLKSLREKGDLEHGKGREEKVISYLLSDAFMQHVFPYLGTENAYDDNLINEREDVVIRYNTKILASGEEAKKLKRERLGEVIKTAIDYARQKGDTETVRRLTEREIGGVKFADFLPQ